MSILKIIYYSNIFCATIPVLFGFVYNKYLNNPLKILLLFLSIGLIQSLTTAFLLKENGTASQWIFDVYVFVDLLFMFFFYNSVFKGSNLKYFLWVATFLTLLFFIFNLINKLAFDYFSAVQSIVFNIVVLSSFNLLMKQQSNNSITKNPLFWVNTGLLLNGIVLVLRIYSGFLLEESFKYYEQLYIFFSLCTTLVNVSFTIGFLKSKKF